MKATINGIPVEGTPEECAEFARKMGALPVSIPAQPAQPTPPAPLPWAPKWPPHTPYLGDPPGWWICQTGGTVTFPATIYRNAACDASPSACPNLYAH